MEREYTLSVYDSIAALDREEYNALIDRENPFLEYEFLEAMEISGCVGPHTTWIPRYLVLRDGERMAGAVAAYIRLDSYGEYIFDWEWARAFDNARLRYYPKLVAAVPFTPATGTRISVHPECPFEECAGILARGLVELAVKENCSSAHVLFLTERECSLLGRLGFLTRITHQYHWKNRNYGSFEDFLSDLRSGRRKQIKKERKSLEGSGLEISVVEKDGIKEEHIDAIWDFYVDTHSRKWGSAYLNREFFDLMWSKYRSRIVLVMAKSGGRWIGGSFNVVKNNRLFGRYWGAVECWSNLHFECCFYSLIDYSINNGIDIFEAGAQGEHKFLRGFGAVPTYSSHLILNEAAGRAIGKFLDRERIYTEDLIEQYNQQSPLKYLHGE